MSVSFSLQSPLSVQPTHSEHEKPAHKNQSTQPHADDADMLANLTHGTAQHDAGIDVVDGHQKIQLQSFLFAVADRAGGVLRRRFTQRGIDPTSAEAGVFFDLRTCSITDAAGKILFEQKNVEVPTTWSQTAANIVANKYFRGTVGTEERETSVKQLIGRVVNTLTSWGKQGGYFASDEDAQIFRDELTHILVQQKMAFNSPVWFNVGAEAHPQSSACFINSVEDTMESILTLAKTEGMIFKQGSGTGSNLSTLRGSKEMLAGGGTASGPVSFMRGFDAFAGIIKSGGKTRRAAKMVILNADHPDIVEFINCKRKEEEKAWALIEAGYDGGFNVTGGAYDSVAFQNANHSVRVTDEQMRAVIADSTYYTRSVRTGAPVEQLSARAVWRDMAQAAWLCGDPGIQFDTTINRWHTCKTTGRINASNPCSEFVFLDDTACNLSSINLLKYRRPDGSFAVDDFQYTVELSTLAMEIIVDFSSYPTERITQNSRDYRPLGLGYANLGALLMAAGLPYDSDAGRAYAAALTALMGGRAYAASADIARIKGPFAGFAKNMRSTLEVLQMHANAISVIDTAFLGDKTDVLQAAQYAWQYANDAAQQIGVRNAQATLLAPTGTIAFMMDCDTTGVEPDIALIKYKKLVGGGFMKIVNQTVSMCLDVLGYSEEQRKEILAYLLVEETIEGAPHLREEHIPVFDCAFRAQKGQRSIRPMGHVQMMAAVQPFLSGAISKTVNMPSNATVEDIENIYLAAWQLGLKAVAIYRDGCKRSQPLTTHKDSKDDKEQKSQKEQKIHLEIAAKPVETSQAIATTADVVMQSIKAGKLEQQIRTKLGPVRRKLPDERPAITHKFSIAGHEGYLTVGLFENGQPGELFCTMSKQGSAISGLMDAFATAISLSLQYGVPLKILVDKFSHTRFEPSGYTGNRDIPLAKSVTDYIFRWLAMKFLPSDERPYNPQTADSNEGMPVVEYEQPIQNAQTAQTAASLYSVAKMQSDAPPCPSCGGITTRSGSCYRCDNCGTTTGCG